MNVRLAKPCGVRVGELVDRLEALSYRRGSPPFAISYCIVPAQDTRGERINPAAIARRRAVGFRWLPQDYSLRRR